MAGRKGRSGRVTTPDQRQRRAAAGSLGGIARWQKADQEASAAGVQPPEARTTPEQAAAADRAAPTIGPPTTWREALQRMNAGVAALKREKLQIEVESLKRERVPMGEVRAFMASVRAVLFRELSTLPGLADQIPEARPHQTEAQRAALLAWIEQFRRAIMETDL